MFINKIKVFLISVASLLVSGCAYTPTESRYDETVNSWVGSDIASLAQSWGYPDERVSLDNGQYIYVYRRQIAQTMPGYTQPGQIEMPGPGGNQYSVQQSDQINTFVKTCVTEFVTNEQNIITKVLYNGNACRFTAGDEQDFSKSTSSPPTPSY